jgi:hypothetical protein
VLTSVITDGVTPTEWMQVCMAAVGTMLVYYVPNESPGPAGQSAASTDSTNTDSRVVSVPAEN